jgi:hypothetical protein
LRNISDISSARLTIVRAGSMHRRTETHTGFWFEKRSKENSWNGHICVKERVILKPMLWHYSGKLMTGSV